MNKLKALNFCDSILESQIIKLEKAICEMKEMKAHICRTKLKIKQEREKTNVNSDTGKRDRFTKRSTIH